MSLVSSSSKMSKSEPSERSRINISDNADAIRFKITKAKTDSIAGVSYDEINRPELANLLRIFSSFSGLEISEICKKYADSDLSQFKSGLIEVLVAAIVPIGKRYASLRNDRGYLQKVFEEGGKVADGIASENIRLIKDLVGLI
eukprot:TRINITY_DN4066_c0_g1_i1.p2 TRINITY_DN4066_c0_g1~~TRINITY_DN4066_c0_g1_i1.p2  ORF type:complete len:144 (-),score=17.90 TRINITY_DN4066_c0_g1_i1:64-495(-)